MRKSYEEKRRRRRERGLPERMWKLKRLDMDVDVEGGEAGAAGGAKGARRAAAAAAADADAQERERLRFLEVGVVHCMLIVV